LFDEGYFAYVEDADFCARAEEAGFRCLYVPGSVLEHPGGGASGGGYGPGRKYLTAHGAARFLRRHGTPSRWASFLVFDVLLWPLLAMIATARGRGSAAVAKFCGTCAGLRGLPPNLSWLGKRTRAQTQAGRR
jgi:GT2 family glycosyltransferase